MAGPLPWRVRAGGYPGLLQIVVGQQISNQAALAIWGRLAALPGALVPERLLALDEAALRAAGLSRPKVAHARSLARAFCDGQLSAAGLERLRRELSPRDWAVLQDVDRCRLMTGRQLQALHVGQGETAARAARRLLARLSRHGLLARLERQVGKLEQREAELHERLAEHATDYARITELDAQLREVRAERERTEETWLALADRLPPG